MKVSNKTGPQLAMGQVNAVRFVCLVTLRYVLVLICICRVFKLAIAAVKKSLQTDGLFMLVVVCDRERELTAGCIQS